VHHDNDQLRVRARKKLVRFLVARDQQQLDTPLAKDDEGHIRQIVDGHELAVSHQTRRAGRPYPLMLVKTGRCSSVRRPSERRGRATSQG
jgi:hypothetical protein